MLEQHRYNLDSWNYHWYRLNNCSWHDQYYPHWVSEYIIRFIATL